MRKTLQRTAFLLAATTAVPAMAQAPPIIPLQGFLTDAAGEPRDGEYVVDIELFDASADGASLHVEALVVDVDNGYFSAELGTGDLLDLAIFRDNTDVWVEVTVDDDVLSPRIQFGSVPYAAYANWAGNAGMLEGLTAAELQATAWGDIANIPADIADGDDVGATTWAELGGIPADLLDGDDEGISSWLELADIPADIADGDQVGATTWAELAGIPADLLDGDQVGATDWSELTGIPSDLLDGDDVADISGLQNRVTGTCGSGQAITGINANGSVVCAPTGGTGSTYTAGFGLDLLSGEFSIDDTAVQARISGSCPAGQAISAVNQDGTVVCAAATGGPFNESSLDLQGVGVYTNTAPQLVWARYLSSANIPFEGARVLLTTNGQDGGGANTNAAGGPGTATVDLGFCNMVGGATSFTIPITGSIAAAGVYMSDVIPLRDYGTQKVCFIRVSVQAASAASPLIVRDISLVPDFDAVALPAP